jgi:tetratricopeptide (TPR) repeat protein
MLTSNGLSTLSAQDADPAAGAPTAAVPTRRDPAPEIKPYDKVTTMETKIRPCRFHRPQAQREDILDDSGNYQFVNLVPGQYKVEVEKPGFRRIARDPITVEVQSAAYKVGVVLLNRGEVRAATSELRRADTLQPGMPETLLELGKASVATGDLSTAEKLLREVSAQEQDSSLAEAAHFQLANIYRKLGRGSDVDREMKRFQEIRDRRRLPK